MAIDNPRATTAYAANRYAPRPSATRSVGDLVTPKQAALLLKLSREAGELSRRMLSATDTSGLVTDADVAAALAEMTPASQEQTERRMMARTDVYPSKLISTMIDLNRRLTLTVTEMERKHSARNPQSPQHRAALQDGRSYRATDGRVFHTYKGQSGQLLSKVWTATGEISDKGLEEGSFVYFAHSSRLPAGLVEMTQEDAERFGRATGTCSDCMRHLENDESVALGIGPICRGKRGL